MRSQQTSPAAISLRRLAAFIITMALIFFTAVGCGARAADHEQIDPEQRIVVKFSHVVAENTPKGRAAKRFAWLVQERTAGRVEVQVYANSTLFKDGEEVAALRENKVQFIAPAIAKMADAFPQLHFFQLPFIFENSDQVHDLIDSDAGQHLMEATGDEDLLALSMWDNGFKQFTSNMPLQALEDFRGATFRIMPSAVLRAQFERLGAGYLELPFSEVYGAMEAKRVDGGENTFSNIYTKGFYRVQEHLTVSNHGYLGYVVLTNREFWEGLPADIRAILATTLAEVSAWEQEQAVMQNQEAYLQLRNLNQCEIYELPASERERWQRFLQPLYQSFRDDVGAELFDELLAITEGGG